MATFKVGQRVRVVAPISDVCGAEGVIVRAWPTPAAGRYDDRRAGASWNVHIHGNPCGQLRFFDDELAPLTDPKADQFIESLKKLANEPLVLTPEETLQIAGGRL